MDKVLTRGKQQYVGGGGVQESFSHSRKSNSTWSALLSFPLNSDLMAGVL